MHGQLEPDDYVAAALDLLPKGADGQAALDRVPVPLYAIDATGVVTYSNPAAADFAGREPRIGEDRWCVTARLFSTTGEPLPHERCPMAEALIRKQPLRNRVAIAERPDGSRVAFRAYPTPIVDVAERLVGGLNVLIDVTEEQKSALAEQADRCRRLADATYDRETSHVLEAMADGFSRTVEGLGHGRRLQQG